MTADVKKHLPPDGGYGWVIVAAIAISNVINVPILQGFALLFRNIFIELEMSTTDISMIINVNSSFGFLLGMMNGPLLKTFGYRKVGMFGTVLMFVGILMTSRATSFAEFIIFYGLMNSAGLIITMSAFGLAMNTYFVKRRSRASGVCMTVTGLGPVFMPLVMSKLIDVYGERGTALIMSGLVLHTFCSAMLMHPIKWHYKKISQGK
ncbi:hypothetical protein AAG570_003039 [Ranatra chinensis]|uniref:Major facilitator superfamily (MFS) profile domain-containing protein n=1 Tax=Ranatra chinensis TaxID=642074 RepID=A0ABD0YI06_9HEMI